MAVLPGSLHSSRWLQASVWMMLLGDLTGCTGDILPSASLQDIDRTFEEPAPQPGQEFLCGAAGEDPGTYLARRLTNREYANTVSTLFPAPSLQPHNVLPPELSAGFDNDAVSLIVTLSHVQGYEQLAQQAVAQLSTADLTAQYASCTELTDTCERNFIENLGADVFRSPVRTAETQALQPIFDAVAAENGTFDEAAGLVLQAMLQSPRFLYRTVDQQGDGSPKYVDGYELANRLSYLVWGGPPDNELFAAAAADALRTDTQIEAQVQRMLQDPKARAQSIAYLRDWLETDRVKEIAPSREHFPNWSGALAEAAARETEAFFEELVWNEQRPLSDLYNAQFTMATRPLAEHYGLPNVQDGLTRYDLSEVAERGGLLTQTSLLNVGGEESSMVMRGLYLLETLLCGKLGDPPPGVDTTPKETGPSATQRQFAEERIANPDCRGCHGITDPLAFSIERYDMTGAYHLTDAFDNELREDGTLRAPGQAEALPYETTAEFMDLLAENKRVQECGLLHAAQFAAGRRASVSDGCSLQSTRDRFVGSGGTYQDLILSIALSPTTRMVRTE